MKKHHDFYGHTEAAMMKHVTDWVAWHRRTFPCLRLFYHVANEGKRHPARAKAEGILAGLPDFHLPVPCRDFCGLWIELKAPGKKPTKVQTETMDLLRQYGHLVYWTDDEHAAVEIIETYCRGVGRKK